TSPLPGSASKLLLNPHINSLTKVDLQCVCLNALPKMDCVRYLYLKWVRFSGNDPFGNFSAPKLQTFVMNNCAGPSNAFRYLRVFTAVARAQQLARLELVGLRFIGGLVEHIVDEMNGESRSFRTMQKLVLAGNKAITEIDAGYFLLASSACLGCVCLQSSLCKDSLFVALCHSQPVFPKLDTLVLGYRDPCPDVDRSPFSVEPSEYPCLMTDYGMAYVGRCFRRLASLTVSRAPFLTDPMRWLDQPMPLFEALRCLTLEKCPCINPNRLGALIIQLPNLEMLVLRDMFDPAPRGCGFLGLAAGQQWGIFPQSAPTTTPFRASSWPTRQPAACWPPSPTSATACSDIRPTISLPRRPPPCSCSISIITTCTSSTCSLRPRLRRPCRIPSSSRALPQLQPSPSTAAASRPPCCRPRLHQSPASPRRPTPPTTRIRPARLPRRRLPRRSALPATGKSATTSRSRRFSQTSATSGWPATSVWTPTTFACWSPRSPSASPCAPPRCTLFTWSVAASRHWSAPPPGSAPSPPRPVRGCATSTCTPAAAFAGSVWWPAPPSITAGSIASWLSSWPPGVSISASPAPGTTV
ncbi:hypothetical protein BOX15_Mlig022920g1, partial [Macrostomum lignano]